MDFMPLARTNSRASSGSTAPMPTIEAPERLISSSFAASALKYSTSSSDHVPRKNPTTTGPRAVRMLSRSCPPWALGKLTSGASVPVSGASTFRLRRVKSILPSLRVRRTAPPNTTGYAGFWPACSAMLSYCATDHDPRIHALGHREQRLRAEPMPWPGARGARGPPPVPGEGGALLRLRGRTLRGLRRAHRAPGRAGDALPRPLRRLQPGDRRPLAGLRLRRLPWLEGQDVPGPDGRGARELPAAQRRGGGGPALGVGGGGGRKQPLGAGAPDLPPRPWKLRRSLREHRPRQLPAVRRPPERGVHAPDARGARGGEEDPGALLPQRGHHRRRLPRLRGQDHRAPRRRGHGTLPA